MTNIEDRLMEIQKKMISKDKEVSTDQNMDYSGDISEKLNDIINSLETSQHKFKKHFDYGYKLEKIELFDLAINEYKESLAFTTNKAKVFNRIAECYYEQDQHQIALDYNQKAISLSPDNYEYNRNRGHILFKMGDFYQANTIFEKIVKEFPDKEINKYFLARTYDKLNKPNQALKYHKIFMGLRPEYSASFYLAAEILLDKEDYHEAKSLLNQYIKMEPDDDRGYHKLCYCYAELEDYKNALIMAKEAIRKDKDDEPNYYVNYGNALYMMDYPLEQVADAYRTALRLDPSFKEAREYLNEILDEMR